MSGYQTRMLPTTYQGNPGKIICEGSYELWWVQRTRYAFVVEDKKKFAVVSPKCSFDRINDRRVIRGMG